MDSISPAPPISTPPVTPSPEPKSKVWLLVLAGVSLLEVGIVVGVLLGKQLYSKPLPPETLVKEGQPIPTPYITANWKTYTSANLGYEIKYPTENIEIVKDKYDFHLEITAPITENHPFPTRGRILIKTLANPNNFPLPQIGNTNFATDSDKPYDLGWEKTMFNQNEAIKTTHQSPGDSGLQTIYLVQKKNIVIAVWKEVADQNFNSISDQILSTFKFLD